MALATNAFILDTSAYSGFNRGNERLRKWFDAAYTIYVPLIVIGELRAGFISGMRTAENEALLTQFLMSNTVETVALSLRTTEIFASLFKKVRSTGSAVSTNDLWIAALAVEHEMAILTLDNDFERIDGVGIIQI
jgi:tRNA(fMet)-specific endonuclease VapC